MYLEDFLQERVKTFSSILKNIDLYAGVNGPYADVQTIYRTVCHAIVYLVHIRKDDPILLEYISILEDGLAQFSHTLPFRETMHKSKCNGLIGPAWTMEAIVAASHIKPGLMSQAVRIFLLHPQDEKTGLWDVVDTDGSNLGADTTFNHQLWFAAIGSKIDDPTVQQQVQKFLDSTSINLHIHGSGRIQHKVKSYYRAKGGSAKTSIRAILRTLRARTLKAVKKKEVGYQTFNLYAFAMLRRRYPNHPLWNTESFKKSVRYIESKEFRNNIRNNRYSFGYNAPGFELPFIYEVFADILDLSKDKLIEKIQDILRLQWKHTYTPQVSAFDRNTRDVSTLTGRLYELTRVSESLRRILVIPYIPKTINFSIVLETENLGMAGLDDLKDCLESLSQQVYSVKNAQQVIIISGAQLDTKHHKELESQYPWVTIHSVGRSINYLEAKLLGAELVESDIVVYADADVIYEPTWLASLLEPFQDESISITAGYTRIREGTSFLGNIYAMALNLTWMLQVEEEIQHPTPQKNFSFNNMAVRRSIMFEYPIQHDMLLYRGAITIWKKALWSQNISIYRVPHAAGQHAAPSTIMDWLYRMMIMGSDTVSQACLLKKSKTKQAYVLVKWMGWKLGKICTISKVLIREEPRHNTIFILLSIPLVLVHLFLFLVGGICALVAPHSVFTWITKRESMHVV